MEKSWEKIKNIVIRFKDLTTLGIANVVSNAISSVFWFYLASLLGSQNYGLVSYFIAIAGLTGTISALGVSNTVIVYRAKEESIQATFFLLTLLSAAVGSIVIYLLFHNAGMSVYIIGYVVFALATAEILGRKLYSTYGKYLVTQKIFLVVLALAFYYLIGPEGVVLGYAISFLPYSVKIYQGFKESKFSVGIIRSHFGFMMNSFSLDLSRTFSNNIDKIIVGPLLGFSLLGNYQLGVQFLSLGGLLPSIVYQYTLPHDAVGNRNKRLKKATILVSVLLAILGVVLAPIVVPVLLPKFDKAIQVIQITSLGIIPLSVNLTYFSKLMGMEKNRVILVGSIIYSTVQVIGIIILGKLFSINGVAASLVLASSSEALYLLILDRLFLNKE